MKNLKKVLTKKIAATNDYMDQLAKKGPVYSALFKERHPNPLKQFEIFNAYPYNQRKKKK